MVPGYVKIFRLLVLITLLGSVGTVVLAEQIHGHNTVLKSASELDYPPFSIVRSDGLADGFSVELLKSVVQVADLQVTIDVGPWHEIKQQLEDGLLDVLPLVSYTPERDKVLDFSVPYLQMHGAVFVRQGEQSIQSVADLQDKSVLVMRDDTAHEYAVRHHLSKNLILTTSYAEAMTLLSSGKYDAVFCQYLAGLQLIKQLGLKNIISFAAEHETDLRPHEGTITGFEQKFCIAVPEGNKELLALLNEGLAIVSANGTYDALYNKWFSPILPQPVIPFKQRIKYVFFIVLPFLFLLAIAGVWYLKREVTRQTSLLNVEIQERKEAQEAIKKSEALLAETGSVGKVGGWEYNTDTKKLLWTDETYRIHEVDHSYVPMLRKGIKFYTSVSLPIINRAVQRAIELDEPFDLELEVITGKGNFKNIHIIGKTDPENARVYGFMQDITARKQAEMLAQESSERFRTLFEHAPISYQSLDKNGCFLEVNETWLESMGYTKKEVLGVFFGDFLHPDWQSHFKEYFPRFMAIGEVLGNEIEMIKKDGSSILMSINGKMSKKPDGTFMQTHCVLHDITKVRQAEEEKAALQIQLRQAQKMEAIGTLAGGIAHDFNNILAAILGYADMAREDTPDSSSAKHEIMQVLKAGHRAKDLVKQILAFSRKEPQRVVSMRLHLVAREALTLLRASLPTTIQIKQSIDAGCGSILADPTQIHQIIMNLCTNAAQAMNEEEGILVVNVADVLLDAEDLVRQPHLSPGPYVSLSVTDSGSGIKQSNLERIFDPYFTTKDVGEGSGMGLAVVAGIVKSCDGMITVESTLGQGTTFTVYFPQSQEHTTEEAGETGPLPSGTERILVVDDEESIAGMAKSMVERLGYAATSATSSAEALAIFHKDPDGFDLVVTDQTMPEVTGEQLAKSLWKVQPNLPVILCSGYSSKIDPEKALGMGFNAFLMKPVSYRELAKSIRQVLDKEEHRAKTQEHEAALQ